LAYGGWEKIEPKIGSGGQGTVYKARSPERVTRRQQALEQIHHELRQVSRSDDFTKLEELVMNIGDYGAPDLPRDIGALKVFNIPRGVPEESKAVGRLQAEMKALVELQHPAILRFLHGSSLFVEELFIITEYHPKGTLDTHLGRYRGRALESLEAFKPLVEAVFAIHSKDAIHRDIKLPNIFLASDGRLVLGDFGIVIFRNTDQRLTDTYERVGSRDWMAPWANTPNRLALEEVNPTLDVFPLGKVLWCMVSGQPNLEYWYFDQAARGSRPANNLEHLFPDDPAMPIVNEILAKCVVQYEESCLKSASELLELVNTAIGRIRRFGRKPDDDTPWPCQVCGKGYYTREPLRLLTSMATSSNANVDGTLYAYSCRRCGHVELFERDR
jgi:serine/threonine protein kinase